MENQKTSLWKAIFQRRMAICLLNGFTAGLPLFYLIQFVPTWLRDSKVDLKTIGLFGLVQLPYTWKFVWSPILDRFIPPLGRRRGWMLITQIGIMLGMCSMSLLDPTQSVWTIAYTALLIAFFSATQDIALDAYRREYLPESELGLGNAMYANAYRIAGFIPGGIGLVLADHLSWRWVHIIIAAFMLVGIVHSFIIKEMVPKEAAPRTFYQTVISPFKEFFQRSDFSHGLLILAFMFSYKFGDVLATSLQSAFFLDMGFSKTVIGTMVKVVGVTSALVGGTIGGMVIYRIGLNRSLWIFGVLQALAIASFAGLSLQRTETVLGIAMALEYFATGLGTAALMAFMAKSTNKAFTGTQFALFSSLTSTPRLLAGPIAGVLVEGIQKTPEKLFSFVLRGYEVYLPLPVFELNFAGLGYTKFFYVCMLAAIPGLILLHFVAPWNGKEATSSSSST